MLRPKRKKSYRKRDVQPFGGLIAIAAQILCAENQQPIPDGDQTDLSLVYWLAFNQMTMGKSSEESWCVVACPLNIGLILTERGIGKEYEPYLIKALDGVYRARLRGERTGIWRFDGEAITAIRQALEIHDEQIKIATKEELQSALQEVHDRIKNNDVYQEAA